MGDVAIFAICIEGLVVFGYRVASFATMGYYPVAGLPYKSIDGISVVIG